MHDPTYNKSEIEANTVWRLAFLLSEKYNDNAPIGWSSYIRTAKQILGSYPVQFRSTSKCKVKIINDIKIKKSSEEYKRGFMAAFRLILSLIDEDKSPEYLKYLINLFLYFHTPKTENETESKTEE